MVYQWKLLGLMPVDAQTAGEELHRIYQEKGRLDAPDIVNESRPEEAPLHPCFEWDDAVAAEKYREVQAGNLVRCIVTTYETEEQKPIEVRAFPCVQQTYQPIEVVVKSEEKKADLMQSAIEELKAFQKKYATLKQLSPVFDAIEKITA